MASITIRHDQPSKLQYLISHLESKSVKIGWFPSARYDDEHKTPVAEIAAQNEFGNPNKNIPARPFLRPAVARDSKNWRNIAGKGMKALLANETTIDKILTNLGERMVQDIQYSISQVYSPALSPVTIEARLARRNHRGKLNKTQARTITKPLIDTGHMRDTVSFEISSES